MAKQVALTLSADLHSKLLALGERAGGRSLEQVILEQLERSLAGDGGDTAALCAEDSSTLHLTAPIIGLVEGILGGETTVGEALRYGDFGIGTFNMLDGEALVVDGEAYQMLADGTAHIVDPSAKVGGPFGSTGWGNQPYMHLCVPGRAKRDRRDWAGALRLLP